MKNGNVDIRPLLLELGAYERSYNEGDTYNIWEAIACCVECDLPMPAWMKQYLSQVSEKLLAIDTPGKNLQQQVTSAIGAKAKTFTGHHRSQRDADIYMFINAEDGTLEERYRAAVRHFKLNITPERVRDLYHKMDREERDQHRKDRYGNT